jgi:hypothetical protein
MTGRLSREFFLSVLCGPNLLLFHTFKAATGDFRLLLGLLRHGSFT